MLKYQEMFKEWLSNIMDAQAKEIEHPIFVLSGITDYVNFRYFEEHLADPSTFDEDGNDMYFDRQWFASIFSELNMSQDYSIISHQQYSYLIEYLSPDFFKDRIIVVYDNLRTLYPIYSSDYVEIQSEDGLDVRPESLPIYQAEQFKIGDYYYYSLKRIEQASIIIPFFQQSKSLENSDFEYEESEVIDIATNPYAIDTLLNQCIRTGKYNRKVVVKLSSKLPLNKQQNENLQRTNFVLSLFGGGIYLQQENVLQNNYVASKDALQLLHKYWGRNASFRDIQIYENPDAGNKTKPVSQGLIVDTIINEYKAGKEGENPRDIFITAPTGAGKSLIFQLPAFYAAARGDVTIVVSPLKALMTDQVMNLRSERKYNSVEFINSDLNFVDRERILERCKDGDVDILYLSPELLLSYDIRYFLGERNLGLLIIDEAHLITTWGRDFRVDYWFLGNHINKIKKYGNYTFPLVAVTATAVYGGTNDMVFDSISSLYMHDPHKFIGEVRRKNIEFVINTHDDYSSGKFDKNKETETLNFIKGVSELGCKTIVYAPFRRHIDKLSMLARGINPNLAVAFHGGFDSDIQEGAYSSFKNNQTKVMICTKAFGMGIDIPDIECVYHHAPSGLLPDYIQEIGRAARNEKIHGFAALTFSPADLRYSKQLFGISSLKTFQLRAVLQKINSLFIANNSKRNMLISASDFGYIFDTNEDVTQKVLTALMMIEKDYLIKSRFNVIVARPKSLFSQVFARTSSVGLSRFKAMYADCFTELNWTYGDYHFLQINLDKIWTIHFSNVSFPKLKNEFYNQKFLSEAGVELTPLLKITYFLESGRQEAQNLLKNTLNEIAASLSELQRRREFFSEKVFHDSVEKRLGKTVNVNKLTSFILSTYAGKQTGLTKAIEGDAFLQRRRIGFTEEYQVFNSNYSAKFTQLNKRFADLFPENSDSEVSRFVSIKEATLRNYMRLGALFEILGIGSFVSQGGDEPKIFIRINDPRKIAYDSRNSEYSNFILESVKNRHKSSCDIFEHFFTNYLDNENRWNLIEDFFLGMSTDDLLIKYVGSTRNRVDILDYIAKHRKASRNGSKSGNTKSFAQDFQPQEGSFYSLDSLLTIGNSTMRVGRWLKEDPVLLHRTVLQYNLILKDGIYKVLMARLANSHKEYYRDFMGLHLYISFDGYEGNVQAVVPYKDQPIKFYKWWKKNQNVVTLSRKEIIELFLKVEQLDPKVLTKAHRAIIEK
jgi:RecQ family ATP-dependent DNA helicase